MVSHPEQGWSLLCNGVILFDDTGELLPDGVIVPPHRPTDIGATGPGRCLAAELTSTLTSTPLTSTGPADTR